MTPPVISLICCSLDPSAANRFIARHSPLHPEIELIVVLQEVDTKASLTIPAGTCVRQIRLDERGLSRARNSAIAVATAPWCAFPDDDCWFETDGLANLVAAARALDDRLPIARLRWIEARGHDPLVTDADPWYLSRTASSIELLVRRDDLVAIGGFDERLGLGAEFGAGEDVDATLRLLGRSTHLPALDRVVVHHRVGPVRPRATLRDQLTSGMSRGRGYGAVQAKHGISTVGVWLSALRSLIPRHGGTSRGAVFSFGVVAGRLSGAHRWRRTCSKLGSR